MLKHTLALMGLFLIILSANAVLIDRGNLIIYDDHLKITQLQDANYAKTSGYDSDGKMTWQAANDWAKNLSYDGYNDGRLPSAKLMGALCVTYFGNCDRGDNIKRSELVICFIIIWNI